jgi:hypothetical protein
MQAAAASSTDASYPFLPCPSDKPVHPFPERLDMRRLWAQKCLFAIPTAFHDTAQVQSPYWEIFLFPLWASRNFDELPPAMIVSPYHCIVLELPQESLSIVQLVIDNVIQTVLALTSGFFTVFPFSNTLIESFFELFT